jgi:hypothetical protein
VDPESFLVEKDGSLAEGEADRAAAWAVSVAKTTTATARSEQPAGSRTTAAPE